MGGNQFMVVDDLIGAFKKAYPQYQRILVETLPPGLLLQQIRSGSLVIGNMRIDVKPDIYTAGKKGMEENAALFEKTVPYSSNKLALMVAKGNPKNIHGLQDRQSKDIRISMPNKKIEGIGETVEEAYRKAGGEALHKAIMVYKVKDSSTFREQLNILKRLHRFTHTFKATLCRNLQEKTFDFYKANNIVTPFNK